MKKFALVMILLSLCAAAGMAGESIRVVGSVVSWTDGMKPLIPEFEKETGIKVNLETYGEDQLNQKLLVEFTASGGADIDVFMTRPLQEGRMMRKNGWYEDLAPFFKDDKDFDFEDFTPGSVECTLIDGVQTSIPLMLDTEVMYYRKDVLAAKGIAPPKTFAELEATAKTLNDPAKDFFGFVSRGQRSALITMFSSYLYSFGGDFFDQKTGKSLVDTPEFRAAAEFYGSMLRKYGPPGATNMHWMQASAIFVQGKAAIYIDGSSLYSGILDPAKSAFAKDTGIMVFPAGPKGHRTYNIVPWGIAISPKSAKKAAAWKFIRYMTDKKRTTIIQGKYMNPCARQSAYKDPEGVKGFPPDFAVAMEASAAISEGYGYDRPRVVAVSEARDIIGEVVVTAIEGRDIAPAAKAANAKFQELLDREKAGK